MKKEPFKNKKFIAESLAHDIEGRFLHITDGLYGFNICRVSIFLLKPY